MVFFNWATMQMAAKIVYYGPGLCGKTSNLSYIYAKTTPNSRGEMVSLETESDRTLFFDLLPIEVGTIGGFKTRLQLYTVPGQVFYNTTRKLVLKGVDGLVFVADSQRPMREANIESFTSLVDNLEDLGLDMADLPLVLQYNKRDLKNILTVDELNSDLNTGGRYPSFEASAINGNGVFETLKEITKLTLKKLRKRMASSQPGGASPAAEPVRPSMSPQRPESISAASLARAAEEGVVSNTGSDSTPPPLTPTTVAPPMPASGPPKTPTDVFSNSDDTAASFGGDRPDDAFAEEPSGEVGAGETEVPSLEFESEANVETDGDQPDSGGFIDQITVEAPSADESWQSEATAVSDVGDAGSPEPGFDPAEQVDFDQNVAEEPLTEPPPMKRVHVSNQLDILAELEGLRVGSFSDGAPKGNRPASSEIDIDSLLSGAVGGAKEIRRRVAHGFDSELFDRIRGLEIAVHVKGADGETIHTLEPEVLDVEGSHELSKLSIRFGIDLDKTR
jgi:signal recognition particle receptor subunit beta